MHHYVYLIENLVNGKVYVGKHSTEDLDDGYMGSGILVTKAIAKYGIENFRKRILEEFETAEKALEFEKQIVNEDFVKDDNTYNLTLGGKGSFFAANNSRTFEQRSYVGTQAMKNLWSDTDFRKRSILRARKLLVRLRQEGRIPQHCDWTNRKHSEETKRKIGEANVASHLGEKNPMFGMIWISNSELKTSKRISKEELNLYLEQGWTKGRKMKW